MPGIDEDNKRGRRLTYVRKSNIRKRYVGLEPEQPTLDFLKKWVRFNYTTWHGNHEVPVLYRDGLTSCAPEDTQRFIDDCRDQGKIVEFISFSQYAGRRASTVEVVPGSATLWSKKPSFDDSIEPETISKAALERRRVKLRELVKERRENWTVRLEFECSKMTAGVLEREREGHNVLLAPLPYEEWEENPAHHHKKVPIIIRNRKVLKKALVEEKQEERQAASGLLLLADSAAGILNPNSTSSSSSTSPLSGNKRGLSDVTVREDTELARRRPFNGGSSGQRSESSSSSSRPAVPMQYPSIIGHYGFLPPPPSPHELMSSQPYPAAVQGWPVIPMQYPPVIGGYHEFLPPPYEIVSSQPYPAAVQEWSVVPIQYPPIGYHEFLPPPPPPSHEVMGSQPHPVAAVQEQLGIGGWTPRFYGNEERHPRRPTEDMDNPHSWSPRL